MNIPGATLLLFLCLTLCKPMDCSTPGFCPSPSPRVCPSLCPLNQWCHPTISSSVTPFFPFFPCLQSFPASGSFPMTWLFASGGQSIGASVSASVLPVNIQGWFPLGWTGLISLLFTQPQFSGVWVALLILFCLWSVSAHILLYPLHRHSFTLENIRVISLFLSLDVLFLLFFKP